MVMQLILHPQKPEAVGHFGPNSVLLSCMLSPRCISVTYPQYKLLLLQESFAFPGNPGNCSSSRSSYGKYLWVTFLHPFSFWPLWVSFPSFHHDNESITCCVPLLSIFTKQHQIYKQKYKHAVFVPPARHNPIFTSESQSPGYLLTSCH